MLSPLVVDNVSASAHVGPASSGKHTPGHGRQARRRGFTSLLMAAMAPAAGAWAVSPAPDATHLRFGSASGLIA